MPGTFELLVILAIVLVIFGAGRLPALGDALGRTIKNFRRSTSGASEIEVAKKEELGQGASSSDLSRDRLAEDAEVVEKK